MTARVQKASTRGQMRCCTADVHVLWRVHVPTLLHIQKRPVVPAPNARASHLLPSSRPIVVSRPSRWRCHEDIHVHVPTLVFHAMIVVDARNDTSCLMMSDAMREPTKVKIVSHNRKCGTRSERRHLPNVRDGSSSVLSMRKNVQGK